MEYVKERHQFGVPIGSFQAVGHGLADAATAVEGSKLIAREAAWAADEDTARATELACLACGFSSEAARDASYRSLHYHGGYGFMVEFDIQLYFRRARAWPAVFGEPAHMYARGAADRLAADRERADDDGFSLERGQRCAAGRGPAVPGRVTSPTTSASRCTPPGCITTGDFHRARVDHGMLAPGWPEEYGGQGRDPLEVLAHGRGVPDVPGAPTYGGSTTLMVANVIRHIGTEEQKRVVLPQALGGEIIIVLGFTEPESGSDVAAAQTRAVRDGDEWVINGQKMFTTNAQVADYVFLLARTNAEVAKHKGLTTFLVPLRQPGVEIQPVIDGVRREDESDLLLRRPGGRLAEDRGDRRGLGRDDGRPHLRASVAAGR